MAPRHTAYALTPASGGRLLALRSQIGLSGPGAQSRMTWVHVGYEGEWKGHPEGPFSLSRADLESCVAAFRAQKNAIGSDYEHASLIPDGQPKPASLWVQDLKVDQGGNLWAFCELTPKAAELVRGGEYRFCSGVFAFGVPDRVAGDAKRWPCVLRSIALTNDPFLDGQQPIALTATGGRSLRMDIPKQALMAALDQIDGDTISDEALGPLCTAVCAMEMAKDPSAAQAGEPDGDEAGEVGLAAGQIQNVKPAPSTPTEETISPQPDKSGLKPSPTSPSAGRAPSANSPAPTQSAVQVQSGTVGSAPDDGPKSPSDTKNPNQAKALGMDGAPDEAAMAQQPPPAPDAAPADQANADAGSMIASKLAEKTGMEPAALLAAIESNLDAVISAIKGSGGKVADLSFRAMAEQVKALTARVETYEKIDAEREQKTLDAEIETLVKTGAIHPAAKPTWVSLSRTDKAAFRKLSATLKPGAAFPAGRDPALAATPPPSSAGDLESTIDTGRPDVKAFQLSMKRMGADDEMIAKHTQRRFGSNAG